MNRRTQWLIGLLALLILGVAGVYLAKNLEHYEETIDKGPSVQAKANPYLAAENFLRQRGLTVKTADSLGNRSEERRVGKECPV